MLLAQKTPEWSELAWLAVAGYYSNPLETFADTFKNLHDSIVTPLAFAATVEYKKTCSYDTGGLTLYKKAEECLAHHGWVHIRTADNWSSGHTGTSTIRLWMLKTGKPAATIVPLGVYKQVQGGCGWRWFRGAAESLYIYQDKETFRGGMPYPDVWNRELRMIVVDKDYVFTDVERKHLLELNYRRIVTLEGSRWYMNGWKPKEWSSEVEAAFWKEHPAPQLPARYRKSHASYTPVNPAFAGLAVNVNPF